MDQGPGEGHPLTFRSGPAGPQRDAVHRNGPHPAAWQIADLLRGYLRDRCSVEEWQAVATAAAAAAIAGGDDKAQAMAELSLGDYHYRRRDYHRARSRYARMLRLSREASWSDGEAAAEGASGSLCGAAGELALAAAHFERSLSITGRAGGRPAAGHHL